MKLLPSSFSATWLASDLRSRLRASSWARWPSNFFLLASLARSACPAEQEIAGEPVLDLDGIAHLAEAGNAFEKNDFHGFVPSVGRAGAAFRNRSGSFGAWAPMSLSCLSRQLEV
jgi:hypothetical protein